ncbi:recombinase family protein [Streptomyces sp. NPDC047928]|uniref:recombinase family protein n=1 Tax=unclassified Streptomyces TaxID=2593676 RepID=UPI0037246B9B
MSKSVACAVAVLYLRLSHESFASDSLEGQEADCIRRAQELAGPDVKIVIFREVVSASKAKVRRREFDAMAEYVKEHRPAFLIAWKWDRVSRQGIRQLAGVRFVSLKDNLDSANPGWVTLASFLAEQAKEEAKNIQLRVAARQLRDRHKGRWVKERPFGFLVNEDRQLEPHPMEAAIVRGMVKEFLAGGTRRGIAARLTKDKVPTLRHMKRAELLARLREAGRHDEAAHIEATPIRSRDSWGLTTVRHILTNPTLAGLMVHDGKIAENADGEPIRVGEGLITEVEHRRILARINTRKGTVKKPGKRTGKGGSPGRPVTFLLAGFLRCGERGAAMTGNRRKPPRRSFYRCIAKSHGHPCGASSVVVQNVERLVADRVLTRLAAMEPDDPMLKAVERRWLTTYAPEYDAERGKVETKAQTLRARLEALEEARWERGEFDDAEGPARYDRLRSRIAEQLAAVESALSKLPEPVIDLSMLLDPEEAAEALSEGDGNALEARRNVLGLVLQRTYIVQAEGVTDLDVRCVWAGEEDTYVPVSERTEVATSA